MHQLLGLFGCEYRTGRAEAAPLLRPLDVDGRSGGHSADDYPLPTFVSEDSAGPHDVSMLPHEYQKKEMEILFPVINAAPLGDNVF